MWEVVIPVLYVNSQYWLCEKREVLLCRESLVVEALDGDVHRDGEDTVEIVV